MSQKSPYILVARAMIRSNPFLELSGTALKALLLFLTRRQFGKIGRKGKGNWELINNGDIVFPYSEAEKKYGITKSRFVRALDQLIRYGFIDINHHGGGLMGDPTTYFISDRWKMYGKPGFIERVRSRDMRNLGFTRRNWEQRTGKKRRKELKTANANVTALSNENVAGCASKDLLPSNRNITEEINPILFINKGKQVIRAFSRSCNENVTVL